jgi:hypothetical protein
MNSTCNSLYIDLVLRNFKKVLQSLCTLQKGGFCESGQFSLAREGLPMNEPVASHGPWSVRVSKMKLLEKDTYVI